MGPGDQGYDSDKIASGVVSWLGGSDHDIGGLGCTGVSGV